jgi:lysozyme family protein
MALVQVAIEYVLKLEDANLYGAVTMIEGDAGGRTRFGLASNYHPELVKLGFYGVMPRGEALILAGQTLMQQYADPMHIADVQDQKLANVFLAYGINRNPAEAIRTMQDACNRLYQNPQGIPVDGIMGPQTMAAINKAMPESLESRFRLLMVAHYAEKAKDNVLRGLIRRALA